MWFVGGLGFCGSLLAFILSFIPPSQISTGSNTVWFSVLIIGAIIVVVAPFIIYASKKPSWVDPNSNFEPFHWEVQAQPATANVATGSTTANYSHPPVPQLPIPTLQALLHQAVPLLRTEVPLQVKRLREAETRIRMHLNHKD